MKNFRLTELNAQYIVLLFLFLDMKVASITELLKFSEHMHSFKSLGCEIVAVLCDKATSIFDWARVRKTAGFEEINVPMLADESGDTAKDYQLFDSKLQKCIHGLVILDSRRRVRHSAGDKLDVAHSVENVYQLVQALKFTDDKGDNRTATEITVQPNLDPQFGLFPELKSENRLAEINAEKNLKNLKNDLIVERFEHSNTRKRCVELQVENGNLKRRLNALTREIEETKTAIIKAENELEKLCHSDEEMEENPVADSILLELQEENELDKQHGYGNMDNMNGEHGGSYSKPEEEDMEIDDLNDTL